MLYCTIFNRHLNIYDKAIYDITMTLGKGPGLHFPSLVDWQAWPNREMDFLMQAWSWLYLSTHYTPRGMECLMLQQIYIIQLLHSRDS